MATIEELRFSAPSVVESERRFRRVALAKAYQKDVICHLDIASPLRLGTYVRASTPPLAISVADPVIESIIPSSQSPLNVYLRIKVPVPGWTRLWLRG